MWYIIYYIPTGFRGSWTLRFIVNVSLLYKTLSIILLFATLLQFHSKNEVNERICSPGQSSVDYENTKRPSMYVTDRRINVGLLMYSKCKLWGHDLHIK